MFFNDRHVVRFLHIRVYEKIINDLNELLENKYLFLSKGLNVDSLNKEILLLEEISLFNVNLDFGDYMNRRKGYIPVSYKCF